LIHTTGRRTVRPFGRERFSGAIKWPQAVL
jgi:hypothetical protein